MTSPCPDVPDTGVVAAPMRQPLGRSSKPDRASSASPLEGKELTGSERRGHRRDGTDRPGARRRQPEVDAVGGDACAANAVDVGLERQARLCDLERSERMRDQAVDLDAAEADQEVAVERHDRLPRLGLAQGLL